MIREMLNILTPMSDGTNLACNIYRPDNEKPYPAILLRTPYIKEKAGDGELFSNYKDLATAGYNVIFQDIRGTGSSEGVLDPTGANEIKDGYDSVEWIAKQHWCDGNVGMQGLSFFGFTQMAAAENNPPHLKAICPFQNSAIHPLSLSKAMTFSNYHLAWIYERVLENLDNWYDDKTIRKKVKERIEYYKENWDSVISKLPLYDTPAARIEEVPQLESYLELIEGVENYEKFMERTHRPIKIENINIPMFFLTGWFDGARDGTIDNWNKAKLGKLPSSHRKLIIGPWLHGSTLSSNIDGIDFGEENSGYGIRIHETVKQWFDYWLKNEQNGILDSAPINIFVLGENYWRSEQEWPPLRAINTKYYIHSGKNQGLLSTEMPTEEDYQTFVYDPKNPLPSRAKDNEGRTIFADTTYQEKRGDVLVYATEKLKDDLEVAGMVEFKLFASTDAVDTDFFCRICDVDEKGYAFPLLSGIARGRFRDGHSSSLLKPNEIYQFSIELGNICVVIKKGHRIKVHISSSFYPEHDPNPNTAELIGKSSYCIKATQKVFHDIEHPSHLILPIIPK